MAALPLPLPLLLLAGVAEGTPRGTAGTALDLGRCRFALGMQDGTIPDFRLSASSAWSDSTAARHGRLGRSDGDGAWCPAGPVFPAEQEFLEVDLGRLHVVTLVGTQGRHAGGHGREFARQYRLRYSRDRRRWLRWRDRWGAEVIGGNEDPEGVVLKDLSPAPVARALRVYPRAPRAMSVCLRLELYGCPWEAGLLSYTAPRGHVMALDPVPIVLNDSTYDGFSAGPLHFGGLGQLSDGVLGLDDFLRTRERRLWPGYDYVGWPRPPGPQPHVELEFEFQELRTFHAMQVHCNNLHTRGVGVFRAVECRFKKILATAWEPMVASHSLAGDIKDPSARSVTVPLGGRHARFIQCRFFFGAEWMLFSEVSFISEVLDDPTGASGWPPTPDPSAAILENAHDGGGATNVTSSVAPGEAEPVPPAAQGEAGQSPALLGCLGAIILLLLAVIILILQRRRAAGPLGKGCGPEAALRVQLSGDTVVINNATGGGGRGGGPRYERIGTGTGTGTGTRTGFGTGTGEYQEPTRARPRTPPGAPRGCQPGLSAAPGHLRPANRRPRQGPRPMLPSQSTPTVTPREGRGPTPRLTSPEAPPMPWLAPPTAPPMAPPSRHSPGTASASARSWGRGSSERCCCVRSSPPTPWAWPPPPGSGSAPLAPERPLLVAVKVLRPDAPKNARRDFLQEARTLGRLRDPNIVRLLGVCAGPGPLCIVTEYMEHGDLHRFLGGPRGHALSLAALVGLGAQIAAGMRFLAARNFVHRDLATRNCLVGRGLRVKVADFGMSRRLRGAEYGRVRGRALLPIRWMAWESILWGTFSPASDAWAFGVTLWEVLTRCREQPYGALSDEQVIANAGHHFHNRGQQQYLPCPPGCPPALHRLMLRCWAREAAERPDFGHLHRALSDRWALE
ncbi:LOW QUALITY PROTEIN: epithelial discoidin domain-containing receptor 1-like [Vidua macroura]|uniref:LOW QUALITY PROTEIN: epithelial discoidin domain-containing receptor 1-like n=1 Tax=Vidua macroura TaxID=187451 RepID=UPI0023A857E8|nr:LOW QUALITY PROTEIN: epithelial discoidin domain-containing receptor 1-like [Vidua macroura]